MPRRHSWRNPPTARTQREATTVVASTEPQVSTADTEVGTVETVPTVTSKAPAATPAPLTVSQRRRQGILTPARRQREAQRLASQVSASPYGSFTPFITDEGTIDLAKMLEEKGSEDTAAMLVATGYDVTPRAVEAIVAGTDVEGMDATDRASLAKLAGLSGVEAVSYITQGDLGARGDIAEQLSGNLKGWYDSNLSGTTASSVVSALWPTVTRGEGRRARTTGGLSRDTLAKAQYLKEMGFSPTELVSLIIESGARGSKGEMGYILTQIAGRTPPDELSDEQKAWYNAQVAETDKVLTEAKEKAKRNVAKLKASGEDYESSDISRIYYNAYPKWSDKYKSSKESYAQHKRYEDKIAARKARQALLVPGEEVTEIAIGATDEELAAVQADQAAGNTCTRINTYKVMLKGGTIVLVQALQRGDNIETGRDAAIAKAEANNYDVAWATKKLSFEKVFQPAHLPTIDVGLYTIQNDKGKSIKIHAPLDADDNVILEMADAWQLPGNPNAFTITERGRTSIDINRASDILNNAGLTSGRAYGAAYMTVSSVYGSEFAVDPSSVPVRTGPNNKDIDFLPAATAAGFRKTETYNRTRGTDFQRINAAYQDYLNAPKVEMPGGWTMLKNSIKDAAGNVLIWGFDSLSPERQEEIQNEIAQESSETVTAEQAGVDETEITEAAQEEITDETPEPAPEPANKIGITIPITEAELQAVDAAVASGRCIGEIRTYFTVKTWKVKLKDGATILVEALTDTLAEEKAKAANYDVSRVSRFFSWEDPMDYMTPVSAPEPRTMEDAEITADVVPTLVEFETSLAEQPQFLQNAYALGGISGYNAAVEVYNDTIRSADRVYGGDRPISADEIATLQQAYESGGQAGYNAAAAQIAASRQGASVTINTMVLLSNPELVDRVNSPTFQQQYAAVLEPAGMSDEEYAVISPYITPSGIDKFGAARDGVPGSAFNVFASENVSNETRAQLALPEGTPGRLILLPYGDYIKEEDFNKYADPIQELLKEDGFPILKQWEDENVANNLAQGFWQNSWDAFFLNSVQIKHDLFSTGVALARDMVKTDWQAGDRNPMYFAMTPDELQAAVLIQAIPVESWGNGGKTLTADQASKLNEVGELAIQGYDKLYDDMQRAQLNWEAERPLLQPVYPEGALEALSNLKSAKDIPLILSETVMSTMPYTLATLGVSAVGAIIAGPVGVALAAPATFTFTFGVEGHQIYADALANGATREQAAELMKIGGAISAAVETAGDSLMAGAVGRGAKLLYSTMGHKFAGEVIASAAAQYGWKALSRDVVLQFINQASQELVQQFVHNAAIKTVNENQQLSEGLADAFVGGLIGTAPFILIPSAGKAIRIRRGVSSSDVARDIEGAVFKPSDQASVVDRALLPITQLLSSVGNSRVARKVASLYVRLSQLALGYAANSAELNRVRESLSALKTATQAIDQEAVTRLKARENELVKDMDTERNDIQSVSQSLVDLLASLQSLDKSSQEAINGIPSQFADYIDELVSQTMQGRAAEVSPIASLAGAGRQRSYDVGTLAQTIDNAKAIVEAIRGVPTATKMRLRIAVNDMTYAMTRLGELAASTPRATKEAVLKAAADLESAIKRVLSLIKNIPENSRVTLLQTVNEARNLAASARFVMIAEISKAGIEVEAAIDKAVGAIKATPRIAIDDISKAVIEVDAALGRIYDTVQGAPTAATVALSRAVIDMAFAVEAAKGYVGATAQAALDDLIQSARRLAASVTGSVVVLQQEMLEFNKKLSLVLIAAEQLPSSVRKEVITVARKLESDVQRMVSEKVTATKETAIMVAAEIKSAVELTGLAVKATPANIAVSLAQTERQIRAALVARGLMASNSVRSAYNELVQAMRQLVVAVRATPGAISAKVKSAREAVRDKANRLSAAVDALTGKVISIPWAAATTVREDAELLSVTVKDLSARAIGELAQNVNILLDAIRSVPGVTGSALLGAAKSVTASAARAKQQVQQLPAESRRAVQNYINSAIDLAAATEAAVGGSADFVRASVADALVTSRVKVKQLPSNMEQGIRNYVSDLKRDILRAQENRLQKAYFKVGDDVRSSVKSGLSAILSGQDVDKSYGAVVDGLADTLALLLRAVQGTDFGAATQETVNDIADAIASGDANRVEEAGKRLQDIEIVEEVLARLGIGREEGVPAESARAVQQILGAPVTRAELDAMTEGTRERQRAREIEQRERREAARPISPEERARILKEGMTQEEYERLILEPRRKATAEALEKSQRGLRDAVARAKQLVGETLTAEEEAAIEAKRVMGEPMTEEELERKIGKREEKPGTVEEFLRGASDLTKAVGALSQEMARARERKLAEGITEEELGRKVTKEKGPATVEEFLKRIRDVENATKRVLGEPITREEWARMQNTKRMLNSIEGLEDAVKETKRVLGEPITEKEWEAKKKGEATAERLLGSIEGLLNTTENLANAVREPMTEEELRKKRRKRRLPKPKSVQQLIRDGGYYLRTNAEELVRAVAYHALVEELQKAESWSDARVKLENYRELLEDELHRVVSAQEEKQTLSDFLSQINWETGEKLEVQKEPPPTLSLREQRRQDMIQDRVRRLFERCPYKDAIYRDLQSRNESVRGRAISAMQEWMEGTYGKDYMSDIIKEVEERLDSEVELGELPGDVVGMEEAVEEALTPERILANEVEEVIKEVEQILKDNENKPPDTRPPDSVQALKPPERTPGGGTRVATAVEEKTAVEEEVAEELTEEEKAALEEAKEAKTQEELTEEQKEALEEAKRKAEEAAEKRVSRRVRPGIAPGEVTRVIGKIMPAEAVPSEVPVELPTIAPIEEPAKVTVEPDIKAAAEIAVEPAIAEEPLAMAREQEEQATELAAQQEQALQEQLAVETGMGVGLKPEMAVEVQPAMQPQLASALAPAVKVPWWKLPPAQALKEAYRRRLPILIWRMGKLKSGDIWKAVIAPQRQANLLTVVGTANLPVRPKRYTTGKGSAARTLQWLGKGPRYKGAADIGIVDVFWDRAGKNLRFSGKGLKTDVGTRMPITTKGIAIEVEGGGAKTTSTKKARRPATLARGRIIAASPAGTPIPFGSLTWAGGAIGRGKSRFQQVRWWYLPPPYDGEPIQLTGPPHGAVNMDSTDPLSTVQIIGRPRKAVPKVRIDLGFAEIRIADGVVEQVIPKTTEEITEEPVIVQEARATGAETGDLELDEEPILEPTEGKTRVGLPKKITRGKKPLTAWEYVTTLKGFNMYTGEGA